MDQRKKRQAYKIFYFIFILFGLSIMAVDPLIPVIAEKLDVGYDKIGIALFIGSIAVLFSTIAAGRLSDRFDIKKIILFGLLMLFTGFLIFGFYLNYYIFIIVLIIIRGGFGAIDTSIHAYIAQFPRDNISRDFITLDVFWHVGAFIGPLLISAALFLEIDPKIIFLFLSAAFALSLIILYRYCPSVKPGFAEQDRIDVLKVTKSKTMFSVLKNRVVLLCSLVLFLFLGATFAFSSWLTTYFLAFNTPVALSSVYLSIFWFSSMAGLLAINQLIKRFKEIDILLWGCVIGTLCLFIFSFVPNIYLKVIFLSIEAMAISGVFSLATSIAAQEMPGDSGTVLGFIIASAFSGSVAFQPIFGYVAEYFGEEKTVFIALIGATLGLIAVIFLFRTFKKKAAQAKMTL